MEEKFMIDLTGMIRGIASEVVKQVIAEELPKILDSISKPGQMLSDLVDYNTAAKMLQVSKPTLHSYINSGKLSKTVLVPGGKPFLRLSEIEAMMIKSRRVNPSLN